MKPMTIEWTAKAEADFATLERESQAVDRPNYDAVCFHAQQCAEKYLKSRLCEAGIAFAKIHDLVALLEQVLAVEPEWERLREDLAYLSDFAVTFRNPGESADKDTALNTRERCRRFRQTVRASLGLEP